MDQLNGSSASTSESSIKKYDVFLFRIQVILIFIVVCVSLIKLFMHINDVNFWSLLLTSLLGYYIPHPKLKNLANTFEGEKKTNKSD